VDPSGCPSSLDGNPGNPVFFTPPRDGTLLGSRAKQPIAISLSRFGQEGSGVHIGRLEPGRWTRIEFPRDSAPDPWSVIIDGPAYVCPLAVATTTTG
jgi:hypothetical protein